MENKGIWEYIYLSSLELDKESGKEEVDIEKLTLSLLTITESLSHDIDPAENFEEFVIVKLCLSVSALLDRYLSNMTK